MESRTITGAIQASLLLRKRLIKKFVPFLLRTKGLGQPGEAKGQFWPMLYDVRQTLKPLFYLSIIMGQNRDRVIPTLPNPHHPLDSVVIRWKHHDYEWEKQLLSGTI